MQINKEPKKVVKLSTIRRCITTLNNAGVITTKWVYSGKVYLNITVPFEAINTKRKRKPSNRKPIK